MSRRVPDVNHQDTIEWLDLMDAEASTRIATIRLALVTPMVGGAFEPYAHDLNNPFSAKAIRGHLRFWWRVLFGWQQPLGDMARQEASIFGSSELSSAFDIVVSNVRLANNRERQLADFYGFGEFEPELYALFSAKQNEVQNVLREGASFDLTFQWPKAARFANARRTLNDARRERNRDAKDFATDLSSIQPQVVAATRAWINFGGIGGRTRRGVGALEARNDDAGEWGLAKQTWPQTGVEVYAFGGQGGANTTALTAWHGVLDKYKKFRQDRTGAQQRGESRWPEPDSVRRITGCHLDRHAPDHGENLFPRAVLGMPIRFWFKDGPRDGGQALPPRAESDPADTVLVPSGAERPLQRLASPVITRPLKIDGLWRSGVVVLRHTRLNNLDELTATLTGKKINSAGRVLEIGADGDVGNLQIVGPMVQAVTPMRNQQNAIDAFITYLEQGGYHLVAPVPGTQA